MSGNFDYTFSRKKGTATPLSVSMASSSHSKRAPAETSRDNGLAQGHHKRDTDSHPLSLSNGSLLLMCVRGFVSYLGDFNESW